MPGPEAKIETPFTLKIGKITKPIVPVAEGVKPRVVGDMEPISPKSVAETEVVGAISVAPTAQEVGTAPVK